MDGMSGIFSCEAAHNHCLCRLERITCAHLIGASSDDDTVQCVIEVKYATIMTLKQLRLELVSTFSTATLPEK